jgi:hypothetical protein
MSTLYRYEHNRHEHQNWCGCCGRAANPASVWCDECREHVRLDVMRPAHERTYFAQNKKPCPHQVEVSP